jgi:sec-independent protein translocase protein TatA
MPTSLGPAEILVILVVALIVLGPTRLPEAGRQVGRFISEVRHWSTAVQTEIRQVIETEGEPQPPPPAVAPPAAPATANPSPLPTPADLGTPSPDADAAARAATAAEWGLPQPPRQSQPGAAAPPPAGGIPPEWASPSTNGDSS